MVLSIALPFPPGTSGPERRADIVDGTSTGVQRHLRRGGLAGFEPITMAALMTLFADQQPGFVFFDVGSNIGVYSFLCDMLFAPSAVASFEPTPTTAKMARRIVKANRLRTVTVHERALGSEPGSAVLHMSQRSDASNSLVAGHRSAAGSVDVDVTTMDRFVEESGLAPSVIKIDVERFEPQVLQGGSATLATHRPALVVEVLKRRAHDVGADVDSVMEGLGYRYYRLGVKPDWQPRPRIVGRPESGHRDWLLVPEELDAGFGERHRAWVNHLATCTAARNSKLPPITTARALRRTDGVGRTAELVTERAGFELRRLRSRLRGGRAG